MVGYHAPLSLKGSRNALMAFLYRALSMHFSGGALDAFLD